MIQPDSDAPLLKEITVSDTTPLLRIPAGTHLDVLEEKILKQGRAEIKFYRVAYDSRCGWLNENFTTSAKSYRRLVGDVTPEEKAKEEGDTRAKGLASEFSKRIAPINKAAELTLYAPKKVSGDGDTWTATVEVHQVFHTMPYQHRLQLIQGLQEVWASIATPSLPDKARLSVVDAKGNEVAGSRWLGGSLIWVQDK